ncbi:S8 family serine peptidase [Conexibacter sp. SYSU D00693]|uniref:S8 family peptidase n=1 Tax=Conexibacter sp. SYSU D00693 TaxID=2812560 RepID=UPI00196BAC4C|nr:S8 family serine peptidase [Conexibacter sp. SYSU D00693]
MTKRRTSRGLVAGLLGLAIVAGTADAAAPPPDQLSGRLIVTLKADARAGDASARTARAAASPRAASEVLEAVAAKAGISRVGDVVGRLRAAAVRPPAGTSPAQAAEALRADPRVARVEVERRAQLRFEPNDPGVTQTDQRAGDGRVVQWWLGEQGFPGAWDIARGQDARVAVIDSGVDANHPDLAGKVLASADFDDTPGNGGPLVDENGHGTHVSTLACGTPDNQVGIAGAGFACGLLVAKSDLTDTSVANSILWAVENRADAIVMSFGTTGQMPAATPVVEAIDAAANAGVVMVAAAADEPVEEQGDPANVLQPTGSGPDLEANKGLSITAAQADGVRAPFAGRGSQISLSAYGTYLSRSGDGLLSGFPGNTTDLDQGSVLGDPPCECRVTFAGDRRYAYLQGTSMSVPVVAGAAALIKRLNPDLSGSDVVKLLKQTARRAGPGWEPELGWGILDAGTALVAARDADRRPPASAARGPRRAVRSRSFTLRWNGKDQAPIGVHRSGIQSYEVWRAANGRPARRLFTTRSTKRKLKVQPGSRYAFFTVAVDRDGNREATPAQPDVTVRVARQQRRR